MLAIRIIFLYIISCLFFLTQASAQATFQKMYGGTSDDTFYSMDISWDKNYLMAGSTKSAGAGDNDFLLQKTDINGNVLWAYTYGGSRSDVVRRVISTSDKGVLLGGMTESFGSGASDLLLVKTDSLGKVEWQKTYGGSSNENLGFALRQSADGGYILGGGTSSFGNRNGYADAYVLKLDAKGNIQWTIVFGNRGDDWVTDIQLTNTGGYIAIGAMEMGDGTHDGLVFEMNNSGTILWNYTYGCSGTHDGFYSITAGINGGWVIAGNNRCIGGQRSSLDADGWFICLDNHGMKLWEKAIRTAGVDVTYSITKNLSNTGYVAVGLTNGTGAGGNDAMVVAIDANGNEVWKQLYGNTGNETFSQIKNISTGYLLVGSTTSSTGDVNGYIVKTDLQGLPASTCTNTLGITAVTSFKRDNGHTIQTGVLSSSSALNITSYKIPSGDAPFGCNHTSPLHRKTLGNEALPGK